MVQRVGTVGVLCFVFLNASVGLAQDGSGDELDAEFDKPAKQLAPAEGAVGDAAGALSGSSAAPLGDEIQITGLGYAADVNGGSVVIQTTGIAVYRVRHSPEKNQSVIEIANAKLPDKFKRPFITKDFRQQLVSFQAYQEPGSTTARVVMTYREPLQAKVRQRGSSLTVSSELAPVVADPREQKGDAESSDVGEIVLPKSSLDPIALEGLNFSGKKISLEVRDTPVREVLGLIADQVGLNLLMSGEITGNVFLKLRAVPWDQALQIVLQSRGLGYIRQGNILRVAPKNDLLRDLDENRRIVESQKAQEPLRVRIIPVSYAAAKELVAQVEALFTTSNVVASGSGASSSMLVPSRNKVRADDRTNSLVVTATGAEIDKVVQLVKALDTPPLQVLIEGKVIESRDDTAQQLGVNWNYKGQDVGIGTGVNLGHGFKFSPTPQAVNSTLDLKLGTLDIFGDLTASLQLLEKEDKVKIISAPRIVTVNNKEALMKQKTTVYSPTITNGAGGTLITPGFKDIELKLLVTPQITEGGDVLMSINLVREFAGAAVSGTVPPINSREAKTNVLVGNGQTSVIGGIFQSDSQKSEEGTPFLRRIPILGWLFKSRSETEQKNELLLFLTPRILTADKVAPNEVAL